MFFINTRPTDRAHELSEQLRCHGYQVIDLPLLALQPVEYDAKLAQLFSELYDTQVIVVVSPTAAQIGLDYLKKSGLTLSDLSHIRWVAVGQATAQYLSHYNINADIPKVESSEGMLQLDCFQKKDPATQYKVAFWRGEGGRQFMMDKLRDQNISIVNFVLYQRHLPMETQQSFIQFVDNRLASTDHNRIYTLITSEASWLNWLSLVKKHSQLLDECYYIVLGERLYQLLVLYRATHNLQYAVSQVENLNSHYLIHTINHL